MTSCGSETLLTASSVFGSLQKGPFPFPQPSFMANIIADLYKKDRIRIRNHPLWQISLRIPTKRTVSVSPTILYGKYHCGSLQKGPYPYPQLFYLAHLDKNDRMDWPMIMQCFNTFFTHTFLKFAQNFCNDFCSAKETKITSNSDLHLKVKNINRVSAFWIVGTPAKMCLDLQKCLQEYTCEFFIYNFY